MNDRLNSAIIFIIILLCIAGTYQYYKSGVVTENSEMIAESYVTEESFLTQFHDYEHVTEEQILEDFDIYNLKGEPELISAHIGDITLINFWATWCAPCLTEIPTLLSLEQKLQSQNFKVIFISFDYPNGPEDLIKSMEKLKIPEIFTFYIKDSKMWDSLGVSSLPFTIVINKERNVLYKFFGQAHWSQKASLRFFETLLNENYGTIR